MWVITSLVVGAAALAVEPIAFVQLRDGVRIDREDRQVFGQIDQPVDVPGIVAIGAGAEMVLFAQSGRIVRRGHHLIPAGDERRVLVLGLAVIAQFLRADLHPGLFAFGPDVAGGSEPARVVERAGLDVERFGVFAASMEQSRPAFRTELADDTAAGRLPFGLGQLARDRQVLGVHPAWIRRTRSMTVSGHSLQWQT